MWDAGDWFKAVAKRRVLFDGQSQNSTRACWIGKVLLSSNEEEAVHILRMLNNDGVRPYLLINEQLKDSLQSALLLGRL